MVCGVHREYALSVLCGGVRCKYAPHAMTPPLLAPRSYAMLALAENMRTTLERAALNVHFLARRRGAVCPQIIDWVNFIRPFDDRMLRYADDDVQVFAAWRSVQTDTGAVHPECWREGLAKPGGHTISVSGVLWLMCCAIFHHTCTCPCACTLS